MKSHKIGKIPKSRFPKMVKKPFKIRKLTWNHIEWEKSENQNFLESLKSHGKSKKSYKISKNPKIEFSFRCVKLRKNPETRVSRFLPFYPLIWAFQTLAYLERRGLKRSIVWYKKFLISCLVARYSTVFVLKSTEINGNPCRSTRSTLQI